MEVLNELKHRQQRCYKTSGFPAARKGKVNLLWKRNPTSKKKWGFDQIASQCLMDLEYCLSWYLSKKDNVIDTLIDR